LHRRGAAGRTVRFEATIGNRRRKAQCPDSGVMCTVPEVMQIVEAVEIVGT
jgi:hypothetical protein